MFGKQRAHESSRAGTRDENKAARRRTLEQMSYEMMEALLVQKIAGLRESEAMFACSLQSARNTSRVADLESVQQSLYSQMHEVEQLLAAMDAAPALSSILPVEAAPKISSSAWM